MSAVSIRSRGTFADAGGGDDDDDDDEVDDDDDDNDEVSTSISSAMSIAMMGRCTATVLLWVRQPNKNFVYRWRSGRARCRHEML